MWFEELTGFVEKGPEQVRRNMIHEGVFLESRVNGRRFRCGELETPSLAELRLRVEACDRIPGNLSVREVVADVQQLHTEAVNAGALFQVASQFNLLEMVSPDVTPEHGVGIYERDHTQGPACAIAAGAGTIFRNYFAEVNGQIGQSAQNQIDCLADLGVALGNADSHLWTMRNGYALPTPEGLFEITNRLLVSSEADRDVLRQRLRIGLQRDAQVTIGSADHSVSQAYCSALPVAYSRQAAELWTEFAKLVLEASYEATLLAAVLNSINTGNNKVFLTLLGGGAFGNESSWIIAAIHRALNGCKHLNLDVSIVSYGSTNHQVKQLVDGYQGRHS